MRRQARVITADEFERLPSDDYRYELVAGVVHRMSPVGGRHGMLTVRLGAVLAEWVEHQQAGVVMTETGFVLATSPDTVRAPDLSFVRAHRIPIGGPPVGLWRGAPDLAVEVLSPNDRRTDVDVKTQEYLRHGVTLVWVVDPSAKTIAVYRTGKSPVTLSLQDALHGADILPEFELPLTKVFPED